MRFYFKTFSLRSFSNSLTYFWDISFFSIFNFLTFDSSFKTLALVFIRIRSFFSCVFDKVLRVWSLVSKVELSFEVELVGGNLLDLHNLLWSVSAVEGLVADFITFKQYPHWLGMSVNPFSVRHLASSVGHPAILQACSNDTSWVLLWRGCSYSKQFHTMISS